MLLYNSCSSYRDCSLRGCSLFPSLNLYEEIETSENIFVFDTGHYNTLSFIHKSWYGVVCFLLFCVLITSCLILDVTTDRSVCERELHEKGQIPSHDLLQSVLSRLCNSFFLHVHCSNINRCTWYLHLHPQS